MSNLSDLSPPFKVQALFEYKSDFEDDLTFDAGQEITVDSVEDEEWFSGTLTLSDGSQRSGMFPKNFVEPKIEPKVGPKVKAPTAHKPVPVPEAKDITEAKADASTHGMNKLTSRATFDSSGYIPLPGQPREESFVHKPFLAAHTSSYVPPSLKKDPYAAQPSQRAPPPITKEESASEEEDVPKLSLKERIALLQQKQTEEAERSKELKKKKQEKKRAVKTDEARPQLPEEPEEAHASDIQSLHSVSTRESHHELAREYTHDSTHESIHEPVRALRRASTQESFYEAPHEPRSENIKEEPDATEPAGDSSDDEEERRRALRERMAKISGGMGMFGMIGSGSFAKKPEPVASKEAEEAPKAPIAVMPFANPASLPPSMAKPQEAGSESESDEPVEQRDIRIVAAPETPDSDSDSGNDGEFGLQQIPSTDNVADNEDDTDHSRALEPKTLDPKPMFPSLPKPTALESSADESDDKRLPPMPPVPLSPVEARSPHSFRPPSQMEYQATGYEADEDTDYVRNTPLSAAPVPESPSARPSRGAPPPPPHPVSVAVPDSTARMLELDSSDDDTLATSVPRRTSTEGSFHSSPEDSLRRAMTLQGIPGHAPPVPTGFAPGPAPPVPIPPIPHGAPATPRSFAPVHPQAPSVPLPSAPAPAAPSASGMDTRSLLSERSFDIGGLSRSNTTIQSSTVEIHFDPRSQWWLTNGYPPELVPSIGKDVFVEVDTHEVTKRGSRRVILKDYHFLYSDYSQLVVEIIYDQADPHGSVVCKQTYKPAAPVRMDLLMSAPSAFGFKIAEAAHLCLGKHLHKELLGHVTSPFRTAIVPAIGNKVFGVTILSIGGSSTSQIAEVKPGDILGIRKGKFANAKLVGKALELGFGEIPAMCVVLEYDEMKKKFKVAMQDSHGAVKKESFRVSDMKSGRMRVFRVVAREYVGW